jgi:hypothetical protein
MVPRFAIASGHPAIRDEIELRATALDSTRAHNLPTAALEDDKKSRVDQRKRSMLQEKDVPLARADAAKRLDRSTAERERQVVALQRRRDLVSSAGR